MTLNEIRAFVAIADSGSVSAAAELLHLTQPAVTRRLQNFEAGFPNHPLFDRSAKPARLTVKGEQVLGRCRAVLNAHSDLSALAGSPDDVTGRLSLGIAHGFGALVLSSPLDVLRAAYPGLVVQVAAGWTRDLIPRVASTDLDCAITLMTGVQRPPQDIRLIPICQEDIVVIAPAGSSESRVNHRLMLKDLATRDWILNPEGCACRALLVGALANQKLEPAITAEILGEDLQFSMLDRNGGLGLVPRQKLEQHPLRRRFDILSIEDFKPTATIALLVNKTQHAVGPAIDRLAEEISLQLNAKFA